MNELFFGTEGSPLIDGLPILQSIAKMFDVYYEQVGKSNLYSFFIDLFAKLGLIPGSKAADMLHNKIEQGIEKECLKRMNKPIEQLGDNLLDQILLNNDLSIKEICGIARMIQIAGADTSNQITLNILSRYAMYSHTFDKIVIKMKNFSDYDSYYKNEALKSFLRGFILYYSENKMFTTRVALTDFKLGKYIIFKGDYVQVMHKDPYKGYFVSPGNPLRENFTPKSQIEIDIDLEELSDNPSD